MIADYPTLVAAVQQYLQRTDLSFQSILPTLVTLAQNRITKDLKILNVVRVASTSMQGDDQIVADYSNFTLTKPAQWCNTVAILVSVDDGQSWQPLSVRSSQYLRMLSGTTYAPLYYSDSTALPGAENQSGNPNAWTLTQMNRYTAGNNAQFLMEYASGIDPLSAENPTNVLIETIPQMFLYGVLLESASYLREDERLQTWLQYYETMKKSIVEEDLKRIHQWSAQTH